MKNFKKIQVDWDEVISIECDKCKIIIDKSNWAEFQAVLTIKFEAGYGSLFNDGDRYECDLCEKCVKELLGDYFRVVDV